MALQLSISSQIYGIDAIAAYGRITNIEGDKDYLEIKVCFYLNQQARKDGFSPIEARYYKVNVDSLGKNFLFPSLYQYLKGLDEYKNAADV